MKIKKLTLSGMRAFSQAEFDFQPGFNLLVGVNGVGKTTVLDALRISLSRVLPQITKYSSQKHSFNFGDITIGLNSLQVSCDFYFNSKSFNFLYVKQRESVIGNKPGSPRESVYEVGDVEKITPPLSEIIPTKIDLTPLALFFSTKRSIISDKTVSGHATAGGLAAAFSESLSANRENNLRLLKDWFKVQIALGEERPLGLKHINVLKDAVESFLPGFKDLRIEETDDKSSIVIDKNGTTLDLIRQLSDGERGVLAMVLDLARRLSQANPHVENPLKEGTAIVLIDELDLHLHPKWQRRIVDNLTRTFPNCQFIATTHSPQIIGEVKPNMITIIDKTIYSPPNSYGLDSSRLLEEVLDTIPRNRNVDSMLKDLSLLINKTELKKAKSLLKELSEILGHNDPEIIRSNTMISFLENDLLDEKD